MKLLSTITLVVAMVAGVGLCAHATQPNVILVLTDDQGYGDMSCHGNPALKTPNLDRLHSESVCLEDFHVDPVCTPTRAALLTGHYSLRTGAWAVTEGRQLLDRNETTMAQVFASSGYRTAMFGKWHLGDPFPYAPQYRGFQEVVCHRAGGVDEIGNSFGNDYFDDIYYRNGKPEQFQGYCTEVWFDETLRFIQENAARPDPKPFFVYLPLNAMHSPWKVAEKYSTRFAAMGMPDRRARFYGMIENFDENLGRLLAALHEQGLEQDTILIFLGDNGTAADDNSAPEEVSFNAGMKGRKGSVHEGGHRVGCFVRWPARLEAGRKVDALTAHIDWLPTLIELCGLKTPADVKFDGRSIAPLLEGKTNRWPERTLFVERQPDQLGKWTPDKKSQAQMSVLTEQWRLVNGELYDIKADPSQRTNVAKQHPEIVRQMLAEHSKWYDDVTSHHGAYQSFLMGAPEENPTRFTARDWHPTRGSVVWEQSQLPKDDLFINGFWSVEFAKSGQYEIRLSRYQEDNPQRMKANESRLQIGKEEWTKKLSPEDTSVVFTVKQNPGTALLQTWLKDAETGKERGAYFISIERK